MSGAMGGGTTGGPRPGWQQGLPPPNIAAPPPASPLAPGYQKTPTYGGSPGGPRRRKRNIWPILLAVGFFAVLAIVVGAAVVGGESERTGPGDDVLRAPLPKTPDLMVLEKGTGSQWGPVRDGRLRDDELDDPCLPSVPQAQDGYIRSWDGKFGTGESATVSVRLLHYRTKTQAVRQVNARYTDRFKFCRDQRAEDGLRAKLTPQAELSPPVYGLRVDTPSQQGIGFVDSIEQHYQDGPAECTEYRDVWALQLRHDVLLVDFETCANRFEREAERELILDIVARH